MAITTIEQAIASVKRNGGNLRFVPKNLRTTEVCEIAVADCGKAIKYVPLDAVTEEMCSAVVFAKYFQPKKQVCIKHTYFSF